MELYKNREQFNDAIIEASRTLKINEALIEKDYILSEKGNMNCWLTRTVAIILVKE